MVAETLEYSRQFAQNDFGKLTATGKVKMQILQGAVIPSWLQIQEKYAYVPQYINKK